MGYAVWERLDTSALEANDRLLDELPDLPGAREVDRRSQTFSGEGGLPLPEGLVTTALFTPPGDATQAEVVDFYVSRLQTWDAETTAVGRALRVEFTRGDDCLLLMTNGMAPEEARDRTFAVAATSEEDACGRQEEP
ncbi:MAG TPA: hypothetical protein VHF23_06005 [Gaiellaceae bacterium]|nr:hypothetical protein [Gaiellaceae bacterium]